MSPLKVRFTSHDGLVLVGEEMGERGAPTVILMHGGGQTRSSWSGAMEMLAAQGYHVINYDARGHGESGWSVDGRYGVATRVEDLRAVLAGLKGPFALVGASMGGATAMGAIADGVEPTALVLVDIVLQPDPVGVKRIFDFMSANPDGFATLEDAADAVAAYNPKRPRPRSAEGLRKNLRAGADGRYYWHWDPKILLSAGSDSDTLARLVQWDGWDEDLPVLLVRGMQSDVITADGVDHMRRAMPQLEVLDVEGAGHMVAGDRNDQFNKGVIAYLERVMPSQASFP